MAGHHSIHRATPARVWPGLKSSLNKEDLRRQHCFEFLVSLAFVAKRTSQVGLESDFRRRRLGRAEEMEGNTGGRTSSLATGLRT